MATCRSCGATIHWVQLASGKKMPVDDERVVLTARDPRGQGGQMVHGTVVIEVQGQGETGGYVVDVPEGRGIARLSFPHWATCPDADSWRKRWGNQNGDTEATNAER